MKRHGLTQKQMLERFPSLIKERDRIDLMLYDVMNNRVTFGAWVVENPDAKYRVGISRENSYPIAMLVFRSKNNGHDSITVFDLEPWEEELRQLRNGSEVWEPVCMALQLAKATLRKPALSSVRSEVA